MNMADHKVVCWECGTEVSDPYANLCPKCKGLLTVKMDLTQAKSMNPEDLRKTPLGVWRYAPFMPVDEKNKVSIQEGGTPLYKTEALGEALGVKDSFVKFEGLNPTGSFKDRGMTMGVSHAKELGAKVVGCASTGNTSASLAAYASKAGMQCAVFLPSGKVAMGKLAQALFFGANVLSVDGNFDDALALARKMHDERKLYLLNSINPYRPEGQKSVLFEIIDQLDYEVPDRIILPVGNAADLLQGRTQDRKAIVASHPKVALPIFEDAVQLVGNQGKRIFRVAPVNGRFFRFLRVNQGHAVGAGGPKAPPAVRQQAGMGDGHLP